MARRNSEDEASAREMREVLKSALRPNKGETAIEFCARVVLAKRFGAWDDGHGEMLIDTFSASAVTAVCARLAPDGAAYAKARAMSMELLVTVCFKIVNKARKGR